jgi:hypothetical protein
MVGRGSVRDVFKGGGIDREEGPALPFISSSVSAAKKGSSEGLLVGVGVKASKWDRAVWNESTPELRREGRDWLVREREGFGGGWRRELEEAIALGWGSKEVPGDEAWGRRDCVELASACRVGVGEDVNPPGRSRRMRGGEEEVYCCWGDLVGVPFGIVVAVELALGRPVAASELVRLRGIEGGSPSHLILNQPRPSSSFSIMSVQVVPTLPDLCLPAEPFLPPTLDPVPLQPLSRFFLFPPIPKNVLNLLPELAAPPQSPPRLVLARCLRDAALLRGLREDSSARSAVEAL